MSLKDNWNRLAFLTRKRAKGKISEKEKLEIQQRIDIQNEFSINGIIKKELI